MNCEDVSEALAAYALDALDAGEAAGVEAHLDGCRLHDEALAELREVVDRLPLAAEPCEPPARLRASILDAFEAEAAREAPVPIREARPTFWMAAAAALLLAVVGLASWALVLQFDDGVDGTQVVAFSGDAGQGELRYLSDDQIAILELELPAVAAGQDYQAWGIFDDGPASLGLVAGEGIAAFRHDLSGASAVAVSIEPAGGSEQPTSDPVLVASFDD